ncbi:MAG: hypothetical protein F4X58_08420 [Chloroflexi bacterium]|nr:hypothetical protein [Chloroflexota bacterium]MYC01934.1 hypothetical protein [Chloroflexota bacterium]
MTIRMATLPGMLPATLVVALLAALGVILAACSSGGDVPEAVQESAVAATQSDQKQEDQPATSYRAGQSETAEGEAAEQSSPAEAEQAGESADEAGQTDAPGQEQATRAEPQASEQTEEAETEDEPSAETEAEPEAMVGQIIESGHRAGLFANRNVVGDPDAPIVITEYSDFL